MSAPVGLRSQYGALFGVDALPVLEELFMSEYDTAPMVRDRIFRNISTDRDIWQSQDINDLPLMAQIPEGTEYTYSRPLQGGQKTFTPVKYGGGFSVSQELVDDARFDVIGAWARKLGKSARASREIIAMNVLNNGFSTELAQDGLSLFNASHVVGPATFSNVITGNPDLSESSLQAALAQFERAFINGYGIINHIAPRKLIVAPENYRYAIELTQSQLKADTADNNVNSIRLVDSLEVISSPYLTDADAWFLSGASEDTGLYIVERQGIRTAVSGMDLGFHTDSIFYKVSYREAVGASRAQGILGSNGSGS
jgi:hypothetical protein